MHIKNLLTFNSSDILISLVTNVPCMMFQKRFYEHWPTTKSLISDWSLTYK